MWRIGEFSKMTNLPVKTLRYYDEIDVLKPNFVDPMTGYRLYDENNLEQVEFILKAKLMNCTLADIQKHILEDGYEMTGDLLDYCEEETQKRIDTEYGRLDYITKERARLNKISPQKKFVIEPPHVS